MINVGVLGLILKSVRNRINH